MALNGTMSY